MTQAFCPKHSAQGSWTPAPEALSTEPFSIVPIRYLYWHKSNTMWKRERLSQVAHMLRLSCSYSLSLIHREAEHTPQTRATRGGTALDFVFLYVCTCQGGQKVPWSCSLEVTMSRPVWMLGTQPGSSARQHPLSHLSSTHIGKKILI